MKNIVLVLSQDTKSRQTAHWFLQKIVTSKEFSVPGSRGNTFIKIVTASPGVEQNFNFTNDWLSPQETISLLAKNVEQGNANKRFGAKEIENLARALHEAADSLPYLGLSLDVIFCIGFPESRTLDSHSFIPVTGALQRLVDWHNGQAMIVKLGIELSPLELHLVEFGHCQVVSSVDELNLDWPGWRGKVAVMDHIENRGHVFPAFWIECDDWDTLLQQKLTSTQETCHKMLLKTTGVQMSQRTVCGRTIEILQEVDLRTFPFFLLDSWTLHLNVSQNSSEILVHYIQSLEQTGLLARLRLYPDSNQIPVCGNMNINTASWKERIITDIDNLQEPQEEQVTYNAVFVYFLLLPNMSTSNALPLSVVGKVLLSPHEINRNIFSILEDHVHIQRSATMNSRDSCINGNIACEELILEEKNKFRIMLDLLKRNITNAISEYQDCVAKGYNTSHEILETAANIQTEIISAAFHECESLQELKNTSTKQQFEQRIKWVSEAVLDPSKFPEKLTLHATEASRKLQSFPSMDSLTASSPLSAPVVDNKKNSADFDVSDISQYFNHDGTIKNVPICPTELKGRGLCRMNSQHDSKTLWPDSQIFRFHDVYYYNNEDDWGLEKRYTKVRDRGYFQDTRSSFVSPLKKNQQTKPASLVSPVRCLSRRSASAQQLMMSSKPDLLKRVSPRKQSIQGIFKQPASHSYSPRKLSQSSTPELPSYCSSESLGFSDLRKVTPDLAVRNSKRLSRSQSDQITLPLTGSSTRDPRNRSFTVTPNGLNMTDKSDRRLSLLASPSTLEQLCSVRRSPRRSEGALRVNASSSVNLSRTEKPDGFCEGKSNNAELLQANSSSCRASSSSQSSAKMKRSDRHKLKLQRIIDHVLSEKGIEERDVIYAACSRNLFNVSMVLLKTLTTSQNLTEEMKTVVYGQVTQIINLEKRRCRIAV